MTGALAVTMTRPAAVAPASMGGRPRRIPFIVREPDGVVRTIAPAGRDAWVLRSLIAAGATGYTAIDNPAPRWSSYVHKLRTIYGLDVETISEEHGGEFRGRHAGYILRQRAEPAGEVAHG